MLTRRTLATIVLGALVAALSAGVVLWATPAFNTSSTLIGRATYEGFKVKRKDQSLDWEFEAEAEPRLDIAVQTIDFPAGSHSGWHSHPGPVFISVVQGTMTFYEGDDPNCEPVVRTAGQGFLDTGTHAHIARNESGEPARNVVTYFVPPGAKLRDDQPNPGNCQFRGF